MATTIATNTYELLDKGGDNGAIICSATSHKIGFYGKAPVAQRPYSSAVHATAGIATSSSFGATQLAAVQEIQNTLIGLGVWATA
jgi:hypothetical protein